MDQPITNKKDLRDRSAATDAFGKLLHIMTRLRAECPWDREQTHRSLLPYLVEEAHEVVDAAERGSDPELCDELGDVLLQVVFHAELASERGAFEAADVAKAISRKMVRRHPHVFADGDADSADAVRKTWEEIKAAERAETGKPEPDGLLDSLPRGLPALQRAERMGHKASEVGFDWPSAAEARKKIEEELAEVDEAAAATPPDAGRIEEEIGDLLFAVTSYARLSGVSGEAALRRALGKFETRFGALERGLQSAGKTVEGTGPEELDRLWQAVKASE